MVSVLRSTFDFAFPQANIPNVRYGWSKEKYNVRRLSVGRVNLSCLILNNALDILELISET